VFELGGGGLDSRVGGLGWQVWGLSLEKFSISVPLLPKIIEFQQANSFHT